MERKKFYNVETESVIILNFLTKKSKKLQLKKGATTFIIMSPGIKPFSITIKMQR